MNKKYIFTFLLFLCVFFFLAFGFYSLCNGYIKEYEINNSVRYFYQKKLEFEYFVEEKNWLAAKYVLNDLKKNSPKNISISNPSFSDFLIIGFSGLMADSMVIEGVDRERELLFLSKKIPSSER